MGRCCTLSPGDVALIDTARGSHLTFEGPHKQALLLIPRAALPLGDDAFGLTLRGRDDAIDALVVEHLKTIPRVGAALDEEAQRAMVTALARLCEATTVARRGREATSRGVRVERALRYVDVSFRDPELGAERVAAAQGVSRRYLDRLMARHGLTLTQYIWERRLDSAAAELLDYPTRSVLEVALANGFSNASHFSRLFRERFGSSPTRWRRG